MNAEMQVYSAAPTGYSFSGLYLGLVFSPLPGGGVPCCRR